MNSIHSEDIDTTRLVADPDVIGPGVWLSIHLMAMDANTIEKKVAFRDFMYLLSEKFPCEKCRRHIVRYLSVHPIESYYDIIADDGTDIGMFKYSWIFHNAVNTRLGKPYVDWETALRLYSTDTDLKVCKSSCKQSQKEEIGMSIYEPIMPDNAMNISFAGFMNPMNEIVVKGKYTN